MELFRKLNARNDNRPGDALGEECVLQQTHRAVARRLDRERRMMIRRSEICAATADQGAGVQRRCYHNPGLGIGANSAIFSVVEGSLLRPLPFPHADRLVRLYEDD